MSGDKPTRGVLWAVGLGAAGAGLGSGLRAVRDGAAGIGIPALLLGLAGLVIWARVEFRFVAERRRYWRAWQHRDREADADFLSACGFAADGEEAATALLVRRVLGEACGVPAETLHAADSLADPIWDSLDMLDVTFRVEKEVGRVLPRSCWEEAAGTTRGRADVRVGPVVRAIVRCVRGRAT